jgi:hypothetical protein
LDMQRFCIIQAIGKPCFQRAGVALISVWTDKAKRDAVISIIELSTPVALSKCGSPPWMWCRPLLRVS